MFQNTADEDYPGNGAGNGGVPGTGTMYPFGVTVN